MIRRRGRNSQGEIVFECEISSTLEEILDAVKIDGMKERTIVLKIDMELSAEVVTLEMVLLPRSINGIPVTKGH